MDKKELVEQVIDFSFKYGLFARTLTMHDIRGIEEKLEECDFIEWLINTVIAKMGYFENKDYQVIKELYLILSDLRFDLRFKKIEEQRAKAYDFITNYNVM